MSAIKLAGGFDGDWSSIIGYAKGAEGSGNIIKFFSEMAKGAKTAASSVDDSAGTIKKALAGISGGAKGAWSSIGTFGKIGLVVAGISLVVGAVQKYKAHMEELRQEAANAANEFADSQSSMDDYALRITELRTALAEGTLTESEAYQAKKELCDIQSQLNASYGSAASGIDLVNGKLDEQIEKLKQLTLLDAQRYLNENKKEIDEATRKMTETLGGDNGAYIGWFDDNRNDDTQRLRQILEKYSNLETYGMEDGMIRIRFVGDATQAKSVLNDFMTDLRAANEEFGEETSLFDDLFDGASSIYNQADEILKDYQDIYEEALRAKMIEESYSANRKTYGDGGNAQTAAKWLDDYTNAVQKYNDALSSGDDTQIADARSEFEQLDSVIQNLLADKDGLGYFAPMFSNVAGALNQSAIAAQNFRETIKGTQEAEGLQRSGMTQSEFAEAFVNGLGTDETSRSVKYLLEQYANEYGIEFSKMTTDQVEAAAKFFADMGVLVKDVADSTTSDTLETLKKSSADTINAISGIQKAQSALASQEVGKSISPSDFASDELKDYASALEYVNGVYQLNAEKVKAIAEENANAQIEINDTNKALKQQEYLENAKQIEQYRKELDAAKASGDDSVETIESNIESLLKENSALKLECDQYDLMSAALAEATGAYQNWINAKSASESGDMFDGTLEALKQIDDTLNNSDSDLFGRIGREDYKAAVDFVVPDTVDKEDGDAVNKYLQSISDLFTYDSNGNKNGLNIGSFIDKALKEGLLVADGDGYRLSSDLKELVRNGAIDISQYNEDTVKLINDYKDLYDKALDCSTAIDDLHESLAQLYKDKFDAIQGNYNNQLSLLEKQSDSLQRKIDKLEEQGYLQNANYYAQMQKVERKNIQALNKELADLNRAFDEAMASGEIEEGSDAWYEMKISIEDTKAAIDDAELSIIKYANSIRQISWDYFDYGQERVSQITDEASFLLSLLDGKDMYDENGNLSDVGIASTGLHAESYGVYMAQADKYAAEIEKINKELVSDPNNKDLIARREKLLSSQRSSILAAKDEKEAMIDLAKNGIQVELDAIKELIDAYTDSLDSAKDLYDYQKKIAEKAANISALEKQLTAYQNDMSEEARSKIQKIQLELKDAQDDLKDTEYDRFVSDAKKALESMYDEYEDLMNSRFDDVDSLFKDLIEAVNNNGTDINKYISTVADSVGYSITETTKSLWENGGNANSIVSVYGTDISMKLTSVGLTVENIFSVLEGIARVNGVPFSATKSYKSGGLVDYTGIANVHGSEDKPEMVLNADDTKNFILLRDAMHSGALASMFGAVRIGSELGKVGTIDATAIDKVNGNDGYTVGSISVSIPIAHVNDYNDFVNQLRDDKQFEQLIQDVTIGKIAGKNSLSKNRHRW